MADLSVSTMVDIISSGRVGAVQPSLLDDFDALKVHNVAVHSSPLFLKYNEAYST